MLSRHNACVCVPFCFEFWSGDATLDRAVQKVYKACCFLRGGHRGWTTSRLLAQPRSDQLDSTGRVCVDHGLDLQFAPEGQAGYPQPVQAFQGQAMQGQAMLLASRCETSFTRFSMDS